MFEVGLIGGEAMLMLEVCLDRALDYVLGVMRDGTIEVRDRGREIVALHTLLLIYLSVCRFGGRRSIRYPWLAGTEWKLK